MKKYLQFIIAFLLTITMVQPIKAASYVLDPRDRLSYQRLGDSQLYKDYMANGGNIWMWMTNTPITVIGTNPNYDVDGGSSRGGGVGREAWYYEPKTIVVDTSRHEVTFSDWGSSGAPVQTQIIDPVNQTLNLPYGQVTNYVLNEGGGGVSRGGGAGRDNAGYGISEEIKEIIYDFLTDQYEVTTINNYTYIVEAAPTYTQITYDIAGATITDKYYFQLPDGRSSWDLKESEIWGLPLQYDYELYNQVPEDDGTVFLNHFDGDLTNVAYQQPTLSYTNPSYNYSNSGNFNQAITWSGIERLEYNLGVGNGLSEYTFETRFYIPSVNTWVQTTSAGTRIKDTNGVNVSWIGQGYTVRNILTIGDVWFYSRAVSSCTGDSVTTCKITTNNSSVYMAMGSEDTETLSGRTVASGVWHTLTQVLKDGVMKVYVNGALIKSYSVSGSRVAFSISTLSNSTWAKASTYVMLDELRLTNRAIYSSNFVPASTPFETNNTYVLPEQYEKEGLIALKTKIQPYKHVQKEYDYYFIQPETDTGEGQPITEINTGENIIVDEEIQLVRWGGVKPTYPEKGQVYIALNKDLVRSVSQFDGSDWITIDGAVYLKGEWQPLIGYDINYYKMVIPDQPTTDPDKPITDPTTPEVPEGSEGLLAAIVSGLTTALSSLFDLSGVVISSFTSLFEKLFVPDQNVITLKMNTFKSEMDTKLGMLGTPFDIYDSIMGRFMATQQVTESGVQMMSFASAQPVISIPEVKMPIYNATIIEPTELNLNDFVSQEPLSNLYNIYLIFIDVVCFLWVINLGKKKYDEITSS